jgi:glycosyltransferase involved in cell wall biosynthesis
VRPVLFATGHAPAYRAGALARLHEREGIEVALFGGRSRHGGAGVAHGAPLPFPSRQVRPHELWGLARSGLYRAVVCPTGGRLAPIALWAGARRGGVPLILWASLWAHPRSAAHALTYLPLRRLYRSADAVVTYGAHVSAYVSRYGARNVHVARQSVDNEFWAAPTSGNEPPSHWPAAEVRFLFVGRPAAEKGAPLLLRAWEASGLRPPSAALVLVGPSPAEDPPAGTVTLDAMPPERLRDVYAACDVLVVPSIPTRTFREPWGLVVNEAMNQGLAVIASDAVGAAAGGLVRDGESGLVVPAADAGALASALDQLATDRQLRERLGAEGRHAVAGYTYDAWAEGFGRALESVGLSRGRW